MFSNLSQFFNNNPWLNILFLVLAVISIVISVILYLKSKKEKLPTFSKRTISIIKKKVIKSNKLEVKYNNSIVDNLSFTEVSFWNSGRETIRGSDIANNDKLSIKTSDNIVIYDYEILFEESVNNFKVTKISDICIEVTFDFLDRNQGIKLKVYHSGSSSSEIKIVGTIMGASKLKLGVEKHRTLNRVFNIKLPTQPLLSSKNKLLKFLGFWLAVILLPFLLIVIAVAMLYDLIGDRIFNTHPKEFLLYDD